MNTKYYHVKFFSNLNLIISFFFLDFFPKNQWILKIKEEKRKIKIKIILSGVQSVNTPYTYIRGCAERIFNSIRNHPPEVDFLHSEAICLKLPLSQIWPSIQTDEHVQVDTIDINKYQSNCYWLGDNWLHLSYQFDDHFLIFNEKKNLIPKKKFFLFFFNRLVLIINAYSILKSIYQEKENYNTRKMII